MIVRILCFLFVLHCASFLHAAALGRRPTIIDETQVYHAKENAKMHFITPKDGLPSDRTGKEVSSKARFLTGKNAFSQSVTLAALMHNALGVEYGYDDDAPEQVRSSSRDVYVQELGLSIIHGRPTALIGLRFWYAHSLRLRSWRQGEVDVYQASDMAGKITEMFTATKNDLGGVLGDYWMGLISEMFHISTEKMIYEAATMQKPLSEKASLKYWKDYANDYPFCLEESMDRGVVDLAPYCLMNRVEIQHKLSTKTGLTTVAHKAFLPDMLVVSVWQSVLNRCVGNMDVRYGSMLLPFSLLLQVMIQPREGCALEIPDVIHFSCGAQALLQYFLCNSAISGFASEYNKEAGRCVFKILFADQTMQWEKTLEYNRLFTNRVGDLVQQDALARANQKIKAMMGMLTKIAVQHREVSDDEISRLPLMLFFAACARDEPKSLMHLPKLEKTPLWKAVAPKNLRIPQEEIGFIWTNWCALVSDMQGLCPETQFVMKALLYEFMPGSQEYDPHFIESWDISAVKRTLEVLDELFLAHDKSGSKNVLLCTVLSNMAYYKTNQSFLIPHAILFSAIRELFHVKAGGVYEYIEKGVDINVKACCSRLQDIKTLLQGNMRRMINEDWYVRYFGLITRFVPEKEFDSAIQQQLQGSTSPLARAAILQSNFSSWEDEVLDKVAS